MNKMENSNSEIYTCKICNYNTDRKFNYKQHLETKKHKELTEFKCKACGKYYKHDSSLSRHRKECIPHINSKNNVTYISIDENGIINIHRNKTPN